MIGAGTIISPIIKIVTTVAILAAVYFFFVKPTLDTVENTTAQFSPQLDQIDEIDNLVPDVQKDIDKALKQAQRQSGSTSSQVDKLFDCINDAGTNVNKINTCNAKFSP